MDLEQLRVTVYETFARTGQAPEMADLAKSLNVPEHDVVAGLRELATSRHLVLDATDRIVMAHPFSAIPLGFSVMGASTLWWGGCAWDSFALPHLIPGQAPVVVATRCPGCGRALAWSVGTDEPPSGSEVAHFLVPTVHMWDDVVHTCGHQSLFCSESCVEVWLTRSGNERGYVMDLSTLWHFASDWYSGRLDYGYTRREPSEASDYLRKVGLSGAFWGL
ncbi:organomercurial lyase [Nocardioides sp.]|uniref:organomercurial lyase n=1 Tax=Nocardioides sp. TaxID=35761 RepID=UPI0035ADB63D